MGLVQWKPTIDSHINVAPGHSLVKIVIVIGTRTFNRVAQRLKKLLENFDLKPAGILCGSRHADGAPLPYGGRLRFGRGFGQQDAEKEGQGDRK